MSNAVYPNPFESPGRPEKQQRLKCCLWEVLQYFPNGLTVSELVLELQRRGLKDFSARRNAAGQVSGDLVRHRDAFVHDPQRRVWYIKPLAPKGLPCKTAVVKARTKRPTRRKSKPEMISCSSPKPQGDALVGCRVRVWWSGDAKFFQGKIVSFDSVTKSYGILYDDGDTDRSIQFRKYEVVPTDSGCESVTVYETDDPEMAAANTITQLANFNYTRRKPNFDTYLKQEDSQETLSKTSEMKMQCLKNLVAGMLCTLNKTIESYHRDLSWLKEMFYTMRGCHDSSQTRNLSLGELIQRIEAAALDTGIFANTIDEERGIHRLHRFCFEAFIQTARGLEDQMDIMVKHGLEISEQVARGAPDFISHRVQEIINLTSTQNDALNTNSIPYTLRSVHDRFQQFHDLFSKL